MQTVLRMIKVINLVEGVKYFVSLSITLNKKYQQCNLYITVQGFMP